MLPPLNQPFFVVINLKGMKRQRKRGNSKDNRLQNPVLGTIKATLEVAVKGLVLIRTVLDLFHRHMS